MAKLATAVPGGNRRACPTPSKQTSRSAKRGPSAGCDAGIGHARQGRAYAERISVLSKSSPVNSNAVRLRTWIAPPTARASPFDPSDEDSCEAGGSSRVASGQHSCSHCRIHMAPVDSCEIAVALLRGGTTGIRRVGKSIPWTFASILIARIPIILQIVTSQESTETNPVGSVTSRPWVQSIACSRSKAVRPH